MSDPGLPVAGWYNDPTGVDQLRWWGGLAWTEHVKPKVVVPPPPAPPTSPASFDGWVSTTPSAPGYVPFAQQRPVAAATATSYPTSSNTPAIWLIAALPIPVAGVRAIGIITGSSLSPVWAIGLWLSLVVVSVALALWDSAVLTKRGLPAPSVLWVLLSVIAYVVARRVKMRKVGVPAFAAGRILAVSIAVSAGLVGILTYTTQQSTNVRVVHAIEEQFQQQLIAENFVGWTVDCDDTVTVHVGADLPCTATNQRGETLHFSLTLTPEGTVEVTSVDTNVDFFAGRGSALSS